MGLLLKLLTLPVTGPIDGTIWVAQQMQAAAEREYYDEAAIREDLMELEYSFEAGELTEEEYDEAADALVERLMTAGERRGAYDDGGDVLADEEFGDA